jgi:hypothetical protein
MKQKEKNRDKGWKKRSIADMTKKRNTKRRKNM